MAKLSEAERKKIIELIEAGKPLPSRYRSMLFGGGEADYVEATKDYRLVYQGKMFKEEVDRCMLNSLVMCLFARKVYDRDTILLALNSVGYAFTNDDLTRIAEKIYATKIRVKRAMGFEQEKVEFPKRFFETPSLHGLLDEATAYEAQRKFNALTNALLEKFKPSPEPKAASDK